MRTPKQIAASKANGARSKGPVTPQGKRNCSRNAIRHGLLARTVVLEKEDKQRFFKLLAHLTEEHHPATPTESMLVQTLAVARWKQDRIWGMQKVAFDHDVETNPLAVLALHSTETVRAHALLLHYEVTLDCQIWRTLRHLSQLQSRSEAACQKIKTAAPERTPVVPGQRLY